MAPAPFSDLLLDFSDGSAIMIMMSDEQEMGIAGSTHAFSSSIASRTESLSSSNLFSPIPRSSALQISTQDNPRST